MRHDKKLVVRVAQRVAPLILVQGLPSFFSNMYCLFDPSSTFVGFSVQNSGGRPVDHVVVMPGISNNYDKRLRPLLGLLTPLCSPSTALSKTVVKVI